MSKNFLVAHGSVGRMEAGKLDMAVRVQACSDEGVCLAPADLPVALNLDDTKPQ